MLGVAGKGEVEVALQFGGVAAEHGHEEFHLCRLRGLAAVGAPLPLRVLAADAVAAHAQSHFKRFLQMPKQTAAGAQGEAAAGLHGFVHRAQKTLLGKPTLHALRGLQLSGELGSAEGERGEGGKGDEEAEEEFFHGSRVMRGVGRE